MEVSVPNFKISQILPDVFYEDVQLKEGIVVKIEKKKTKEILDLIKDFKLNSEKIYLKSTSKSHTEDHSTAYSHGKISSSKNIFDSYDISFIKRIKPLDTQHNLILISFTEHLDYLNLHAESPQNTFQTFKEKLIELHLFTNEEELNQNLTTTSIPYKQPLTESQSLIGKKHWNMSTQPTSTTRICYTHLEEELSEVSSVVKYLIASNKKNSNRRASLLYDAKSKMIIEEADEDDDENTNPIGHSIMKLINAYSDKLAKVSMAQENVCEFKGEKLLGTKINKRHFDDYLDNLEVDEPYCIDASQYYCESLYVFSFNEPCFMCSMALVHSRVERIYFISDNKVDGALKSRLKINNYNLNHSYLIFKVDIN